MDKNVIYEYADAKALVEETEEDIRNHKKVIVVQDKVKGSNPEYPFNPQSFSISGNTEIEFNEDEEERILLERQEKAKRIKVKAEKIINKAPPRIQRIIRFKIMDGMAWNDVAEKMGGNCTGDSVRMEFQRWMKKK